MQMLTRAALQIRRSWRMLMASVSAGAAGPALSRRHRALPAHADLRGADRRICLKRFIAWLCGLLSAVGISA